MDSCLDASCGEKAQKRTFSVATKKTRPEALLGFRPSKKRNALFASVLEGNEQGIVHSVTVNVINVLEAHLAISQFFYCLTFSVNRDNGLVRVERPSAKRDLRIAGIAFGRPSS